MVTTAMGNTPRARGFTLIELLVVMAVVALLLGIAAPRYVKHLDRGREAVLRQNLFVLRDAIDKFYADHGRYPDDLAQLVRERYLREVPVDPMLERSDAWRLLPPKAGESGRVYDVRSKSDGKAQDGTPYATW